MKQQEGIGENSLLLWSILREAVVSCCIMLSTQSRKTPGIPYRCDVETATVQAEAAR
jgi:hypothetical protein